VEEIGSPVFSSKAPPLNDLPDFSFLEHPTERQISQVLALYQAAGWWQSQEGTSASEVAGIIAGSHSFLTAVLKGRDNDTIIAMGRSISDGVSDAYIQDVAVLPAYRGKGIASRLIALLVSRLKAEGIGWIGLIAERNTQELYRRLGFSPMADATPMIYRP
jgi:aralkylamine N-acetyltransferase